MIRFHQLIPGGFEPRRASRSANGTLPTNGYRYCEPLRSASAFGWYVYLPMEFWLIWDGSEIFWSIDKGSNWYPLDGAIQYPGFSAAFDEAAPEGCKGHAPPFMTRAVDHNVLQVWTGLMVRTEPGYAILSRPPANAFWRTDYKAFEGIIETDRWMGPLFTNIMLRTPNKPIVFRTTEVFLQLQVLPISLLREKDPGEIRQGLEAFTEREWEDYENTIVHRVQNRRALGEYAVESRKRPVCPVTHRPPEEPPANAL